ncbi:DUF1223 domain-containing protein [Congregibacter brevis]|uniref:DUF1223 domain-containing protein n=1 Tax=Congregibacter brevis TaxID=3081201 RepID=A0ABZ0IHK9_9GAMM|nr:DUF1223 domain-containing protein [Congregibacter sp. IMCC45268]
MASATRMMNHYRRHTDRNPASSLTCSASVRSMFWIAVALGLYLTVDSAIANAQSQTDTQQSYSSGPAPVPLVELYTSEGCSSCPPADRWISGLKAHKGLWTDFVPVAFHVNYWDSIGWPDRFAKESFGQRQRQYAREGVVRGVYTPGVVAGGTEWHGWRQGRAIPTTAGLGGELHAVLHNNELRVRYSAPGGSDSIDEYRVHVAWLSMEQVSEVRRGENRGKRLVNDFVVLAKAELPLVSADGKAEVALPKTSEAGAMAKAVALWVSAKGSQAPLQATGGWIH